MLASQWLMFTATRVTFSTGAANLMQCGGQHRQPPKRQPVMVSGKGSEDNFNSNRATSYYTVNVAALLWGSRLHNILSAGCGGPAQSGGLNQYWKASFVGNGYPAKLGVCEGLLLGRFVEFLHLTAAGQLTSSNGSNEHLMMHQFQWV